MVINKNLTTVNYTKGKKSNTYIVIHFTGNNGDTAKGNTTYFKSTNRGASAHYFVDTKEIWQCVEDTNTAWHCGTKGTYYCDCRNNNSIGIEMCSVKENGVFKIPEATIYNTIELTKSLMKKYNIPASRVIRHYDVTHKMCPEPFVRDINQWNDFKSKLVETPVANKHWCEDIKNTLLNKGIISDDNIWSDYNATVTKGLFIAIIDKATGGNWPSEEANSNIHWAQPALISLCGKQIIKDKSQWEDYDSPVSRALALATVDNSTMNSAGQQGREPKYVGVTYVHWCLGCLNSLCDKKIIQTVGSWVGHWDEPINRADCMALIYKAYFK